VVPERVHDPAMSAGTRPLQSVQVMTERDGQTKVRARVDTAISRSEPLTIWLRHWISAQSALHRLTRGGAPLQANQSFPSSLWLIIR